LNTVSHYYKKWLKWQKKNYNNDDS
jgi:hypothetical protein